MKTLLLAAAAAVLFSSFAVAQQSDAALRRVIGDDVTSRDSTGKLRTLSASEHLTRAEVYSSNRMFPQAREHWQKIFDNYPDDPGTPKALFGTARSFMWEKEYAKAVQWFDKLTANFLNTKDGREGLAFKGASLVRLGKNLEAAKVYEQYVVMFPDGERIESAHLNIIDAYREAGKYDDANQWIDKTAIRFSGKPAEVNALHARLRMEIYREKWRAAVEAADALLRGKSFAGAMAGSDEVKYLKAISLDKLGSKSEAAAVYASIPASLTSYFGGLASEKLSGTQIKRISSVTPRYYSDYPVMFRSELMKSAKKNNVDPRFVLAIMKQESSFRANAKSPAGARGLLQLVFDTAVKYNKQAGYPGLHPDDLYDPATNIAVGTAYMGDLKDQFDGLYEAIAASYNGGEDNAARWLNRSKPKDPGVFTSEVGFAESKNYVFKVMNNYRIYRELYTEDLNRR
ncbi:MAG TPA: transglycosylase SLT domain-containing protein [Pyrinomonadaceae bacterium]|nr:transglycosylase SLT domain-containing protein [Pyrinomonadaceae bacterium]